MTNTALEATISSSGKNQNVFYNFCEPFCERVSFFVQLFSKQSFLTSQTRSTCFAVYAADVRSRRRARRRVRKNQTAPLLPNGHTSQPLTIAEPTTSMSIKHDVTEMFAVTDEGGRHHDDIGGDQVPSRDADGDVKDEVILSTESVRNPDIQTLGELESDVDVG